MNDPTRPRRDEADPTRPDSPMEPGDAELFETPFGREDDHGTIAGSRAEAEIEDIDVHARPASEVTGAHDAGGANETVDGLDEAEEAVRRMAEDQVEGGPELL
ncbi:hypothetical protein WBG79_22910 [Prosthecomicrobium sp. N25]